MGFAVTRAQARQLVAHKAVLVNGKKVNIPSYQVRPGDAIALTEKARSQLRVQEAATEFVTMALRPIWVEVDSKKFEGTFTSEIGRAPCRDRVCQYVWIPVVAV